MGGRFQLNTDQRADLRNHKIGFVFQGFNLLARTSALENVELPMFYLRERLSTQARHERAKQSLEIVGFAQRFDHHPSQLSGGQQQRYCARPGELARAILADEPTGNLDSQTSIEIMGVFQKLNEQGITIVMVTHELDIASCTKRNIILRDGQVLSDMRVAKRLNAEEELRVAPAQEAVKLA